MPPINLVPMIEPLKTRFPSAWAKAQAPHDDGEFNARVCSVLFYEQHLANVGRNGKRGGSELSRDVINWRADDGETGPNPDPQGGSGWIIDFIVGHETPNASIGQLYPDPSGPGDWVKPKTLTEIDKEYSGGGVPVIPPFPPRDETMNFGLKLNARYGEKGAPANGTLGGRLGSETRYADYEGEIIWTSEYLRRRQLGESHDQACANVLADVDAAWPK